MNARDDFVTERRPAWERLNALLTGVSLRKLSGSELSELCEGYRQACNDLERARSVGCTADVVEYLEDLSGRAYQAIYRPKPAKLRAAGRILFLEFPFALRSNLRFFLAAAVVMVGPAVAGLAATWLDPTFASRVLPPGLLDLLANSYVQGFDEPRAATEDAAMAGFYVRNNTSIAFRCFATGIFAGIGSVFFLAYNGLVIGTTVGYVARVGALHNLLAFMSGHGPLELTAVIIAGAAGIKMGSVIIDSGGRSPFHQLREQSAEITRLVLGAAFLLLLAALVEGFWSASDAKIETKLTASFVGSLALLGFLLLGGRNLRGAPWT